MFNCNDIIDFSSEFGYKYYSLRVKTKILEEFDEISTNYYREHIFWDIEEALAFTIYLSGFQIFNYLMEDKVLNN